LKKACELDPLSLIINTNCGDILYHARRYDEAIGQYRKTLEIDQNFLGAHQGLGKAYIQKSMFKEAVKEFVLESPVPFYRVIYAYISLGKKEEAFALLEKFEEMSTQQYVRPIILFEAYLSVDNIDKAFELLDKLYQERSPDILDKVLVDPFYDRIRSDPRYKDFLKKIDLFE
jgi:tetratricopeptide (TPR) repeat protein